jgi:hypothetical protein
MKNKHKEWHHATKPLKYIKKNPKHPKKTEKKQKKNQKTHWAGFFLNPGFFQPCLAGGRAALAHCRAQIGVGAEEQAAQRDGGALQRGKGGLTVPSLPEDVYEVFRGFGQGLAHGCEVKAAALKGKEKLKI